MIKSNVRLRKEGIIDSIKKNVKEHDCFYVIGMDGINVNKDMDFRRICRKNDITVKVVKNTFISMVLKELNLGDFGEKSNCKGMLHGVSAMLFVNESYGTPGRIIKKFRNDSFEPMTLKFAYVSGDLYIGEEGLNHLSSIKTLDETLTDIVLAINSCSSNIVNALLSCGRLVNTIKNKK